MIAIVVGLYIVAGPPVLGMAPFVVAFAVFHFSWPAVWTTMIGAVATTLVVLLAVEALGELWFLALITVAVGAAAMLIRTVETVEARRAQLNTELAVIGERNRVARDVHDVLGHSLTAVILKAELCDKLLTDVAPADEAERRRVEACREQLTELRGISRSALAEIRSTVGGLRALNLADEVTVARTVLADAGVDLIVTGEVADVAAPHRPVLAWVVREAVTNVVRHASAANCHIDMRPGHNDVVLRVCDDGVGFSAAATASGNGLRGVRERIEAAGGELVLRAEEGTIQEVGF